MFENTPIAITHLCIGYIKPLPNFLSLNTKKWLVFPTPIGPEYGQEWLIDILGNLQEKIPKIHAIIMDDDPTARIHQCVFYEDFVQRLHTLGLQDRVSFIGKKST